MSCMFWSVVDAIDAHNGAVTAIATMFIAAFTVALVSVSRRQWRTFEKQSAILDRQATLMQAQFDQWINLTNWECVGKPQDNVLKVKAGLVNPTNFPIKVTGTLIVAPGEGYRVDDVVLLPNSPIEMEFKISIPKDEWSVQSTVVPDFTYLHRITNKLISQRWVGRLDCAIWAGDHQWHPTFTQLSATHAEKS